VEAYYDDNNRPVIVVDRMPMPQRTVYDAAGRAIQRGRVGMADGTGAIVPGPTVQIVEDAFSQAFEASLVKPGSNGGFVPATLEDFKFEASTITSYDSNGRVQASIDARGFATHYAYDALGRQSRVTNALGIVVAYDYDPNGNRIHVTSALGQPEEQIIDHEFDALNRQTKITFPNATHRDTVYDPGGRRVAEIDQAGVITGFGYDGLGRLRFVTNDFRPTPPLSGFLEMDPKIKTSS
jgi:YD repeat-containing protein